MYTAMLNIGAHGCARTKMFIERFISGWLSFWSNVAPELPLYIVGRSTRISNELTRNRTYGWSLHFELTPRGYETSLHAQLTPSINYYGDAQC